MSNIYKQNSNKPSEGSMLQRNRMQILLKYTLLLCYQVFKPDKMNGYEIQTKVDAMLEQQRRDILPTLHPTTPKAKQRDNKYVHGFP